MAIDLEHCNQGKKIDWIVRPATMDDADEAKSVLFESYSSLLPKDYHESLLERALPLISVPQDDLLTCGTWYVAQHPETKQIVCCGGWTPASPPKSMQQKINQGDNDDDTTKSILRRIPHLRHFACHPQWIRKGAAKAIWNKSLDEITRVMGPTTTSMEVFSTISAEPFYRSLGFETIKTIDIPLAEDCLFPSILMRRDAC